ncbi:Histone acetyltransferase type B catalytic subunit [Vitis vinifera]|uniref:histone acetyltransferase n=1 Tax=Vitis vinifera TaxID=29760 RepID=A0A438II11_VITVI|nr:Histone acetyltransferase type B catalytic subunit [Vitis vinifera]
MGLKQQAADPAADPKKRRRVGFSNIDTGVEAKDCIKIFLVSRKDEVGASDSFCIDPVDLNSFFEEDGKIYGYQGLKITVWINSISFHSYADITFQSTSDGGKGITDLKSALQTIFAETLVETKDDFLQTFSTERHYIRSMVSNGEILQHKASIGHSSNSGRAEDSDLEAIERHGEAMQISLEAIASLEAKGGLKVFCANETRLNKALKMNLQNLDLRQLPFKGLSPDSLEAIVIRMVMGNMAAGHLYSRLIPLVLLLVDGSNPIDIDDPRWEIYLLVQKKAVGEEDFHYILLGFTAVYRFYHYPDSSRLRISQILVLPPYQHKGYGHYLLEVLYSVAISEDVHDLTVEEPLDYFQHVRTCVDTPRLLGFDPIQPAVNSVVSHLKETRLSKKSHTSRLLPPLTAVEEVQKGLKINKKHFLYCWEVLIYLGLEPIEKYMENYTTFISDSIKSDIIGKDSETSGKRVIEVPSDYDQGMSFVMFRSQDGEATTVEMDESQTNQEEQLQKLVNERLEEIKLVARKLSPRQT